MRPFSVVPFSLWQEQNLTWNPLASQFLRGDNQLDAAALTWQDVPCRLGEIPIRLVDQQGDTRSKPLLLTAKFALSRIPSALEKEAILGESFIVDNSLTLSMRGIAGKAGRCLYAGGLTIRFRRLRPIGVQEASVLTDHAPVRLDAAAPAQIADHVPV